jgi:hypothetical protein
MYEIEKDFSTKTYDSKVIEARGRDFDINYSSILTKLIQECGRLCESYASDLFITWDGIAQKLKEKTMETSVYLFGIREMGVDHNEFILNRYNNDGCYTKYEYRKIYRLNIIVEGDLIRMELYEIERPFGERSNLKGES